MAILHFDVDAFAAAVERVLDPLLLSKPIVIGREAAGRGVVACASYEARALGVRNGMPVAVARRRAPECVFLPGRPLEYERFSLELRRLLCGRAPVVEAATLDDFYLDLRGCERLFGGDLLRWGARVSREAADTLGLPLSLGIGANKMMARVATRLAKPGFAVRILAGSESEFLAPVSVGLLPGIGRAARRELHDFGVRRIGQLAALDDENLRLLFGETHGAELQRRARGEDFEPVTATALHRHFAFSHVFEHDTADLSALVAAASFLAQRLGWNLRSHELRCSEAKLEIAYTDGATASRALPLAYPSSQDGDLAAAAAQAVAAAFKRRVRVRSMRLVAPFAPGENSQSDLFHESRQRRTESLTRTIDAVRAKHGFSSMLTAGALPPGGKIRPAGGG